MLDWQLCFAWHLTSLCVTLSHSYHYQKFLLTSFFLIKKVNWNVLHRREEVTEKKCKTVFFVEQQIYSVMHECLRPGARCAASWLSLPRTYSLPLRPPWNQRQCQKTVTWSSPVWYQVGLILSLLSWSFAPCLLFLAVTETFQLVCDVAIQDVTKDKGTGKAPKWTALFVLNCSIKKQNIRLCIIQDGLFSGCCVCVTAGGLDASAAAVWWDHHKHDAAA